MPDDPLFLCLYLDEDFHPEIAELIRQQGYECESAVEASMLTRTDDEQLAFAVSTGRCLVSFNVRDFFPLAIRWAAEGRTHAGILVTPQVSRDHLGDLTRRLLAVLKSTTADEMIGVIRYF